MRWAIALIFCGALSGQASAKEVNLRNQTDADGNYNVAFCARPSPDASGKPGHAFVSFSHVQANGERSFVAVGHTVGADVTPAKAVWSYFGSPVAGLLKAEHYTSIRQNCLDVQVNKVDYLRAFSLAQNPLAKLGIGSPGDVVLQAYKLGAEDCMAFAIDVAKTLASRGLKVPERGAVESPMSYVQRLSDAN